jgi:flavorubredoxin
MEARLDEIADGIYRLSAHLADVAPPFGLTVNQFLVMAEDPLLFHTGLRATFPGMAETLARVVPLDELRWVSFGHVEADECGALNLLLAAAPHAQPAFGGLGRVMSVDDFADRLPHRLDPGDALDLGGRRVVAVATPHAPHNTEAQVLYEETTGTLLCGDLFTQAGRGPAVTGGDLVGAALDTEALLRCAPPGPAVPRALRRLAELEPRALAVMHGSSFEGDAAAALLDLALGWEQRFDPASPGASPPGPG